MYRYTFAVALALVACLLMPGRAEASFAHPHVIRSHCNVRRHSIVIPYLHRYHVRIGGCRGYLADKAFTGSRRGTLLGWNPFQLGSHWHWSGIVNIAVDSAVTIGACGAFAAAFAAEAPTAGFDTAITLGAAGGCVGGVLKLSRDTWASRARIRR